MATKSREPMAVYPNLQKHRLELGWSIPELLQRTEQAPSDKSVRRLEKGVPVRVATAHKLFNTIVSSRNGSTPLLRDEEIKVVNVAD